MPSKTRTPATKACRTKTRRRPRSIRPTKTTMARWTARKRRNSTKMLRRISTRSTRIKMARYPWTRSIVTWQPIPARKATCNRRAFAVIETGTGRCPFFMRDREKNYEPQRHKGHEESHDQKGIGDLSVHWRSICFVMPCRNTNHVRSQPYLACLSSCLRAFVVQCYFFMVQALALGLLLLYLENHFNLDRNAQRQLRHADRGTGMLADRLAEYFDHQVRKPVDDFRLVGKSWRRVHHAENFDDPLHLVETSQIGLRICEKIQPDRTCGLVALLERQVLADLSLWRGRIRTR